MSVESHGTPVEKTPEFSGVVAVLVPQCLQVGSVVHFSQQTFPPKLAWNKTSVVVKKPIRKYESKWKCPKTVGILILDHLSRILRGWLLLIFLQTFGIPNSSMLIPNIQSHKHEQTTCNPTFQRGAIVLQTLSGDKLPPSKKWLQYVHHVWNPANIYREFTLKSKRNISSSV